MPGFAHKGGKPELSCLVSAFGQMGCKCLMHSSLYWLYWVLIYKLSVWR